MSHQHPPPWRALLDEAAAQVIPHPAETPGAFVAGLPADLVRGHDPFDRAVLQAARADRVAWAVLAGHQAALSRLDPKLSGGQLAAFCASEREGAHPKTIAAQLVEQADGSYVLRGEKRWATLSPDASILLVVASTGWAEGQNRLRVARVGATDAGVAIEPYDATSSTPEIRHATVTLREVEVARNELLPGDGYLDAVKPFRTLEDLYIAAAISSYELAVAGRFGFPHEERERLFALLLAARQLAALPAVDPMLHLGLAGWLALVAQTRSETRHSWSRVRPSIRAGWQRDTSGREVAQRAKEARRLRAWQTLGFT